MGTVDDCEVCAIVQIEGEVEIVANDSLAMLACAMRCKALNCDDPTIVETIEETTLNSDLESHSLRVSVCPSVGFFVFLTKCVCLSSSLYTSKNNFVPNFRRTIPSSSGEFHL